MKKKSLFLLVSSMTGLALVGGTFAAWAVTDNAPEFEIKVSTGSLDVDSTINYVTLSYGESQDMRNVAELQFGEIRKAGVLDLRADTSNSAQFWGELKIATSGSEGLLAKLDVKVYETDVAATNGVIASVQGLTEVTVDSYGVRHIRVADNTESLYTVAVSFNGTRAEYEEMAAQVTADIVTIRVNWDACLTQAHGHQQEEAQATPYYATGFSGQVYAYAFDATGKVNKAWPGVEMVEVRPGYYGIDINNSFTTIVFNNGKSGNEEVKSADIVIATSFTDGKNLYTHGAQDPFGTYVPEATPDYWLVGNQFGDWKTDGEGAIHLTNPVDGVYTTSVTTTGNAAFKILDAANGYWYGEYGQGSGNFTLGDAGTYTITFNPAPTGTNPYIASQKTA